MCVYIYIYIYTYTYIGALPWAFGTGACLAMAAGSQRSRRALSSQSEGLAIRGWAQAYFWFLRVEFPLGKGEFPNFYTWES